jgi:hypothetical protein
MSREARQEKVWKREGGRKREVTEGTAGRRRVKRKWERLRLALAWRQQ